MPFLITIKSLIMVMTIALSSGLYAASHFETQCLPKRLALKRLNAKKSQIIKKYGDISVYFEGCDRCQGHTRAYGVSQDYLGFECTLVFSRG